MQTISNDTVEQTYLGQILVEPELAKEASAKEEMFYGIEHQVIYKNIKAIVNEDKPLDIAALMIRMYENRDMEIVQNRRTGSYLTDLAGSIPTTANFKFYEKKLFEAYKIREAKKQAAKLMDLTGADGDEETVFEVVEKIQKAMETGVERTFSLSNTLLKIYDRVESGQKMGIPTGFAEYDRMTLGLNPSDLIIVGARPSMGKTAFCLNVADNQLEVWNNETGDWANHVHIFSLEMTDEQLVQRMVGTYGRIDAQRLRTGELTDEDWGKFSHAMGRFSGLDNLDIYDDSTTTVPDIRAKVQAAKRKFPKRQHIVLIDYLQLLTYHGKPTGNKTQEVGDMSKALKQMAKDLFVPVVALSQLSRGVESRQDKRPIMSDIRESGNIEQDADVITFLYRDDYYDHESESKNIIDLIIAKQRNGPVGTVSLAFVKEYGLFVNLERRFGEAS